jgi:hypothetical protein
MAAIAISLLQQEIQRRQKMLPALIVRGDARNRKFAELQG